MTVNELIEIIIASENLELKRDLLNVLRYAQDARDDEAARAEDLKLQAAEADQAFAYVDEEGSAA